MVICLSPFEFQAFHERTSFFSHSFTLYNNSGLANKNFKNRISLNRKKSPVDDSNFFFFHSISQESCNYCCETFDFG